jgi:hypothetical protein
MVGSAPLSTDDGFRLWGVFHYPFGMTIGDSFAEANLKEAFQAGYELAMSQSTQGSGEWDPEK